MHSTITILLRLWAFFGVVEVGRHCAIRVCGDGPPLALIGRSFNCEPLLSVFASAQLSFNHHSRSKSHKNSIHKKFSKAVTLSPPVRRKVHKAVTTPIIPEKENVCFSFCRPGPRRRSSGR
ncbi:hypothetical protein A0H81_04334 [Grifola frondosa]|uniref:Secreted protein n=1 Tax=Grifola frondosa TaxID=5627 RepID=A0A1C7MGF0_GRIFR|nr:hypothetical protein A0H81_04334 [Grifola frondosa]